MKLGPDLQVKLERLKVYKCDRCPKVFPSLSDIMNHMSYHDQHFFSHLISAHVVLERATFFSCDICPGGFSTNRELMLHKLQHVQQKVNNQRKLGRCQISTDIPKTYKCPDCDYSFVDESTLKTHSVLHLPFPHICHCGIGFYKQYDLKNHMKLVHRTGEKQKDKKDILKKQTQDKKHGTSKGSKIKKEIVTKNKKGKQRSTDKKIRKRKFITPPKPNINVRKTDDNKFECPVCKKTFIEIHRVYVHYRIHSGERPFSCHICGKSYTQSCVLSTHLQTHNTERTFKCRHCPKAFKASAYRDRHEIIHSVVKPYDCPYCNKGFHDMSALARHKRTHTGEKRYKCPFCPKAFSDVSGYRRHKLLHEKGGRFECDICLKVFPQIHKLRFHRLNMHESKDSKFYCDFCKKFFRNKSYLVIHMRCHMFPEKVVECKECHKKFNRDSYLQRHIRDVHENVFKRNPEMECDACSKKISQSVSNANLSGTGNHCCICLLLGIGVTPGSDRYIVLTRGNKMNNLNLNISEKTQILDKNNPKTLTQQIFHKGMFMNRPRSSSFSGTTNQDDATIDLSDENDREPEEKQYTEVHYGKRQRSSPDAIMRSQKQTKLNYWLAAPAVPTSNIFAGLDDIEQADKPETQGPRNIRPPPMFIDGVKNIQPLQKLLEEVAKGEYEIKVLRSDKVKIQSKTAESYSTIYKELKAKDTEFYSYQPKQNRSFRVVLKNLHASTDKEEIKIAIEELGHKVTNVWNIQNSRTKQALPMWNIELESRENNKDIYSVKSLLHCRILFEAPRPKRIIPQCTNCQDYNHTQNFCNRKPRCVKCAGPHHTSKCPRKERSNQVKCVLCEGNHPANYKGCTVYKELLKVRYPPPITQQKRRLTSVEQASTNKTTNAGKSYAAAAKELPKQSSIQTVNVQDDNQKTTEFKVITETLSALLNQMLIMTQTLTDLISKMTLLSQH